MHGIEGLLLQCCAGLGAELLMQPGLGLQRQDDLVDEARVSFAWNKTQLRRALRFAQSGLLIFGGGDVGVFQQLVPVAAEWLNGLCHAPFSGGHPVFVQLGQPFHSISSARREPSTRTTQFSMF